MNRAIKSGSPVAEEVPSADPDDLREAILDHPYWYHRIELDDDFYTPGYVDGHKFDELGLPDDLSGTSVLDICSYNGLFAFEAERRGADRVLATDLWDLDDREAAPAQRHRRRGFDLAHAYLDSDVEAMSLDLRDLSPEAVGGTFDVVLCAGVIYRLKNPWIGIENLVSTADERVVITSLRPTVPYPTAGMEFYETNERMGDPSIWWVPAPDCLEGMMRVAGCSTIDLFHPERMGRREALPPVESGELAAETQLYRDHRLTEPMGRRSGDHVNVLYRREDAVRIQYEVETAEGLADKRQAWVRSEDVRPRTGGRTGKLARTALETVRSEGLASFARKGLSYVFGDVYPSRVVAHGFV